MLILFVGMHQANTYILLQCSHTLLGQILVITGMRVPAILELIHRTDLIPFNFVLMFCVNNVAQLQGLHFVYHLLSCNINLFIYICHNVRKVIFKSSSRFS